MVVQRWLTRISMTLGLGIPLSVAVQLWLERKENKPWLAPALWAGLAAALTLYLFFLLPTVEGMIPILRYFALLLAAVALVPAVPYLPKRQGDERFALKLLWRLFITGVFTGILIGGVSLVLFMLEKLLNVKLWNDAYFDVSALSIGLFMPSFFLAGVPHRADAHEETPFQPLLRILLGYIIFPLLAVYTVIIYAYFVRIVMLWSWPSNMLVNMVLWYTAIGVLAVYFMRSQSPLHRWFGLFDRWYPRLTVLPLILMFVGLFIRIGAYGFTEPRFFVLILALWVTAFTAMAIVRRPEKRLNVLAPTLLAALAVLSVLGPWSAFDVSRMSQTARFEQTLARNAMLSADGSAIMPKNGIPDGDKATLYSILDYFTSRQTPEALPLLPKGFNMEQARALLGFDRPTIVGGAQPVSVYIFPNASLGTVEIGDYNYIYLNDKNGIDTVAKNAAVDVALSPSMEFTILKGGTVLYKKDLKDYAKLYCGAFSADKKYTFADLTQLDENGAVAVKFIFNTISANTSNGITDYNINAYCVFIRVK